MAPVPPHFPEATHGRRPGGPAPARGWPWPIWLLIGLCFGLGYGLTQRLALIGPLEGFGDQLRFGVKPFPGTGLDRLREQAGEDRRDLRGDLERLEREKRQKREEEQLEKRRADLKEREELEAERRLREQEQARREALERELEAEPAPAPLPEPEPLPEETVAEPLPPPAPEEDLPELPPPPEPPADDLP
ncbi:MAG: hypothetical protein VKI81_05255 [Synechococcaceae cyanobacterium]|nr:hypothetical protein [Synechococcaceae cyanobacterium]